MQYLRLADDSDQAAIAPLVLAEFARSKSCHGRMLYLHVCQMCLETRLLHRLLKTHFLHALIRLHADKVIFLFLYLNL